MDRHRRAAIFATVKLPSVREHIVSTSPGQYLIGFFLLESVHIIFFSALLLCTCVHVLYHSLLRNQRSALVLMDHRTTLHLLLLVCVSGRATKRAQITQIFSSGGTNSQFLNIIHENNDRGKAHRVNDDTTHQTTHDPCVHRLLSTDSACQKNTDYKAHRQNDT